MNIEIGDYMPASPDHEGECFLVRINGQEAWATWSEMLAIRRAIRIALAVHRKEHKELRKRERQRNSPKYTQEEWRKEFARRYAGKKDKAA